MRNFFLIFYFFSVTTLFSQNPLETIDSNEQNIWVETTYNSLTTDQKIGQLFTIWVATEEGPEKMKEIESIIKKNQLGGLIFSLGNIKDQAEATNRFQSISKVPLLIGMDAEWGIGMRLDDAFSYPYNMTLGAVNDNNLINRVGERIGVHAKRLGVHINFAPVTDINTNPNNPVIGSRSFGEDKFNVTKKSLAYLKGMQSQGIMGSAKHFPGHGDTSKDSHKTLPTINFDKKRIDDVELYPYKELINNNLSGVMVAHMEVPSLEKTPKLPSTLSKNIVTKILKNKLKFKGLVITDAMDMKGVVDFYKDDSADVRAFLAGNDILLMPDDLDVSTREIKKALKNGRISEKRLEKSVKKILMAKYKAGLHSFSEINIENIRNDMNTEIDKALFESVTKKSITLIKNQNNILPIEDLSQKIAYLKIGDSSSDDFFKMLNHYTKVDLVNVGSSTNKDVIDKLIGYDIIIIGFHKSEKSPFDPYKFSSKEISLVEELALEKKIILDVFSKPYALLDLKTENINSILISYQNNSTAQSSSAQIIFGAIPAVGVLPVSLGREFPVNTSLKTEILDRLSYSHPINQGFDVAKLKEIDLLITDAINKKMTPGAQIIVSKNGDVVYNKSFGKMTYDSQRKIKWDDIYDLASLTKILSTVPLMIEEYEKKTINLETTLDQMFPNLDLFDKSKLTIKEMFTHQSGLLPWIPFYKKTLDSVSNQPDEFWYKTKKNNEFSIPVSENLFLNKTFLEVMSQEIIDSELSSDKSYVYSDLPYYFMKSYLEKKNSENLDIQLKKKSLTQ